MGEAGETGQNRTGKAVQFSVQFLDEKCTDPVFGLNSGKIMGKNVRFHRDFIRDKGDSDRETRLSV